MLFVGDIPRVLLVLYRMKRWRMSHNTETNFCIHFEINICWISVIELSAPVSVEVKEVRECDYIMNWFCSYCLSYISYVFVLKHLSKRQIFLMFYMLHQQHPGFSHRFEKDKHQKFNCLFSLLFTMLYEHTCIYIPSFMQIMWGI